MEKPSIHAETIGSLFEFLFESTDISVSKIRWPPDAFCFVATALQRSSAYTGLVALEKAKLGFDGRERDREEAIQDVGERWRSSAAKRKLPPQLVGKWLGEIRENRELPLANIKTRKRLLAAMINMMAAADESCAGLGISLTSSDNDEFTRAAELQLYPGKNGSSLCRNIHPSKARVLPKCHTPQTGLTIRSFSHFLALASNTEVRPEWFSFFDKTNQHGLNLLLIPWPNEVIPKQFRATEVQKISDEVDRGGYGLFTFDALGRVDIKFLKKILRTAEKTVGRIDGIVFPEIALSPGAVQQISRAFVRENRFLIAGVGRPAKKGVCGQNYIRFDVMLPGGQYVVWLEQKKHHRWKLEKNQLLQYGLGSVLNPEANWWEHIDLSDRSLMLVTLKPWLTACVLVCEDLARPDPLGELIHAVGPNLVICLLMDGPQLSGRWPGRYATSLADDPGSSVLSLTSVGMTKLSRAIAGNPAPPGCIALWKDARSGSAKEIVLPTDAQAIVLCIAVEYCEEWTADGRGDKGNAGYPYLVGQHPIRIK